LPISRNDILRNAVTALLPTPPFWLQTATFVIPWIVYGRFYFGKLTPCAVLLQHGVVAAYSPPRKGGVKLWTFLQASLQESALW
jgi:hypothetical protein